MSSLIVWSPAARETIIRLDKPSPPWPPSPPMLQRPRTPAMGSVASPQSRGGCDVCLCVRICCRPCRCCLWGLLGELNLFVCKPKGVWCHWGFNMTWVRLVECLLNLCFWIWCHAFCMVIELMFTFVQCILLYCCLICKSHLIWPVTCVMIDSNAGCYCL